jgi:hypothetical protein
MLGNLLFFDLAKDPVEIVKTRARIATRVSGNLVIDLI